MKRIFFFIIISFLYFYLLSGQSFNNNYNKKNLIKICKMIKSGSIILLMIKGRVEGECIPCKEKEFNNDIQWSKLIKYFKDKNIKIVFMTKRKGIINIKNSKKLYEKIIKNYPYYEKGVYTILFSKCKVKYYKEGILDFNDYKEIIKLVTKFL